MMDFTEKMYQQILVALKNNGYSFMRIQDFLKAEKLPEKFVVIRHDVDLSPVVQLRFAKIEEELDVFSSYYFRYIEEIFKPEIMDDIYKIGHEIGYHYEVITKTKGDKEKAVELFKTELDEFKKRWDTQTICPHGGSFNPEFNAYNLSSIIKNTPKFLFNKKSLFSNWVNFNIWENYRFEDFGLLGDAYDSIDFKNILYLSDTGMSWKKKYKRLDHVDSEVNKTVDVKNSRHLIQLIESGNYPQIYLLVHFEQWKNNFKDWLGWYLSQLIRRTGKKIIFGYAAKE
ncbi:MAG: hypothetical protein ACLFVR_16185 [Thiohalospira sp.]